MNLSDGKSLKQKHEEAAYSHHTMMVMIQTIMIFFSRSVEAFLRINFGERYFNILGASGSLLTLGAVVVIAFTQLQMDKQSVREDNLFLGLFLLLYVVVVLVHIWVVPWVRGRYWPNELVHTRYAGMPVTVYFIVVVITSLVALCLAGIGYIIGIEKNPDKINDKLIEWFFWLMPESRMKLYLEPLFILVLAGVVALVSKPLAVWLGISGICLAVNGQMLKYEARQHYLDMIDQQLEAQEMANVIKGIQQPADSHGVEVWGAFTPAQQNLLLKGMEDGQ